MTDPSSLPTFTPPGPGVWEMDAGHFPRPAFGGFEEVFPPAFENGMRASLAAHGMMLEGFHVRFVNGFPYMQPIPVVGPPPSGKPPPPPFVLKLVLKIMSVLHPKVRARMRVAKDLFVTRPWRDVVKKWDDELKPQTIAKHAAIDGVDLRALDDRALADHVDRLKAHVIEMATQDHSMNMSLMIPLGDYLAQVAEWTGMQHAELMLALRGSSPISTGDSDERCRLVAALRNDAEARAILESGRPPRAIVHDLKTRPGPVGDAMRAFWIISGNAICHGLDLATPSVDEDPAAVLWALRITVKAGDAKRDGVEAEARVRARVPERHRAAFDALLDDARLTYRLRDERHLYGALPTLGLARKAIVEVGRRLVARGAIANPDLAVVMRLAEMAALLRGQAGPAPGVLEERFRLREILDGSAVPHILGGAAEPPPPYQVMPNEGARRSMRALATYMGASDMLDAPLRTPAHQTVEGLAVSRGVHEGIARVCVTAADLARVQPGDVLVAPLTTPAINIVLPILGAIVTDRGGALSHAAIVSREYGIPGVVGTREATKRIKDGARIRVDGESGVVTLL